MYPSSTGHGGRVYDLFRRWQRDSTWHRILTHLQVQADAKDMITWDLSVAWKPSECPGRRR
ncbi:hypothetical protein [Streptomyces sp. NBC_01589]|uniref:hypothetical protein n=1 Tax=unclassified Streptomyces TaxID=2593676 RepID=UPI00386E800D